MADDATMQQKKRKGGKADQLSLDPVVSTSGLELAETITAQVRRRIVAEIPGLREFLMS